MSINKFQPIRKTAIESTRREFVKKAGSVIAGAAAATSAPYVFAQQKPKLRVLGTHVTLQDAIRDKAKSDLGIEIIFETKGSASVLQKASTRPHTFDLYEQWSNSLKVLWDAKAIQSIDLRRIEHWTEVNDLTKTGRLTSDAKIGAGDAPYKLLYVQEDDSLSSNQTKHISFLPYVHNVDSFGYNTSVIPRGEAYETESWGWLFDQRWAGKVGLVNEPTIGTFDAALAAQATGKMDFADIGNMTRDELDELFRILVDYRRSGHISGVWNSVPQSVDFMLKDRVVIQSMFSPAVSTLNARGIPVMYAAPKEGYRAWHGVMCLSSKTEGYAKDAAYDYMNWWLSGWAGAFIARQGYYISNPQRSRAFMSDTEWDYWYAGNPAAQDIKGTDGGIVARAGTARNGGSYTKRFSNVAVWNTVMDTYEYSLQRWYEFLTA